MSETKRYEGPIEVGTKFVDHRADKFVMTFAGREHGQLGFTINGGGVRHIYDEEIFRQHCRPLDSPEAQPEKPMRSGPVVEFVPGMTLLWRWFSDGDERRDKGDPFVARGIRNGTVASGGGKYHTDAVVAQHLCAARCYEILSCPTQQPSPSHVCKGRPCGEKYGHPWKGMDGGYLGGGPIVAVRWFCSTACRDAWKPEARARPKTCEASDGSTGYPCGLDAGADDLCDGHREQREAAQRHRQPSSAAPPTKLCSAPVGSAPCAALAGSDGICDIHRRTISVAPSPNPWRCGNLACSTPTAGPHRGTQRLMWKICVGCAEVITPAVPYRGLSKEEAVATLGAFHEPGSVPVSPHLEAMGGSTGSSWWPSNVEVD